MNKSISSNYGIEEIIPAEDVLSNEMRYLYGGGTGKTALKVIKTILGGGKKCKSGCSRGSVEVSE